MWPLPTSSRDKGKISFKKVPRGPATNMCELFWLELERSSREIPLEHQILGDTAKLPQANLSNRRVTSSQLLEQGEARDSPCRYKLGCHTGGSSCSGSWLHEVLLLSHDSCCSYIQPWVKPKSWQWGGQWNRYYLCRRICSWARDGAQARAWLLTRPWILSTEDSLSQDPHVSLILVVSITTKSN